MLAHLQVSTLFVQKRFNPDANFQRAGDNNTCPFIHLDPQADFERMAESGSFPER